jgi:dephospho-CoA kinase
MLRVALTGGMATGKSYVLERFRERGVPCLDADVLAHGITAAGTEATHAIAERFGRGVIGTDGAVDRHALGAIVFRDPSERQALEAIVHPAVYRSILAGLRAFEQMEDPPLAVVDVPLLFETGHEREFARVIVTACPVDLQVERLVRRGLSESEARRRISAQWPTEKKAALADFVVRTDGSFEDTGLQVDAILQALVPPG